MNERPNIRRGDVVQVDEEHRLTWIGTVLSVKPSKRGWWVEVRDEDGYAYSIPREAILLFETGEVTHEEQADAVVVQRGGVRGGSGPRDRRRSEEVLMQDGRMLRMKPGRAR